MQGRLSVIIPCYNEADRLPPTLEHLQRYFAGQGCDYELLVVDDGSTDGTVGVASTMAARDPRVRVLAYSPNRGKGYAVRFGVMHATGDRVLISDADLSIPIDELERLSVFLDQGYDVAIGSRAIAGAVLANRPPMYRVVAGRAFNLLIRSLGVRGIYDSQCGFKLYSRRAARDIFPLMTVDRWAFDVEALVLASLHGYRIREVPVTLYHSPNSRVSLIREASRTLSDLMRIRLTWTRRRFRRSLEGQAAMGAAAG